MHGFHFPLRGRQVELVSFLKLKNLTCRFPEADKSNVFLAEVLLLFWSTKNQACLFMEVGKCDFSYRMMTQAVFLFFDDEASGCFGMEDNKVDFAFVTG